MIIYYYKLTSLEFNFSIKSKPKATEVGLLAVPVMCNGGYFYVFFGLWSMFANQLIKWQNEFAFQVHLND